MSVKRHEVTQPVDASFRLIALTQGQNAIVDVADFEWLSQWSWFACWDKKMQSFYATRKENGKSLRMHRTLLKVRSGEEVDHWNHNTLDNRRSNLRRCSHTQNMRNKKHQTANPSGYKGVTWAEDRHHWRVRLMCDGKMIHLGRFHSKEEAARAYDKAAIVHFGEFAVLNFPKVAA